MVFTLPWMLLGLAALPALVAVYWLRRRSRRAVVSSLVFWSDQRTPRRGGRTIHRLQTPLCFFLELLAILLLVAAAAGPALQKRDVVRPLVVVLDDSYSMLARGAADDPRSARQRAETAVVEELQGSRYLARFILAGAQPRLLGDAVREPARAGEILSHWTCQSPAADLPAAVSLAAQVGGPMTRILVLSDHPPTTTLGSGQIEWWAFGGKLPNMAFTAATRTRSGEIQRVLLEVTNLSDSPGRTTLTLEGGNLAAPRRSSVELAAGAARQFFLELPAGAAALRATLGDDALAIDNGVLLLPQSTQPLRVQVALADDNLRRAVVRALEATARTIQTSERPDLAIADQAGTVDGETWRLEILRGKQSETYAGPFVIDRNHAATQGLSLQNAIWSASPRVSLGGLPVITAGNVPLLTDREDVAGRHRLQMAFVAELSSLQEMPDWPILFANLVGWRWGQRAGVATPNVRLGQTVAVALAREAPRVEIVSPSKARRELDVRGRRVAVPADQVGLHVVKAPEGEYLFSCNTVSRDESDLSGCRSGRWGNWGTSETYKDRQIALSWVFLLAALAVMTTHMAVVAKGSEGRDA
jgi:hypothetical protein